MHDQNPYRPPDVCIDDSPPGESPNVLGKVGFGLSMVGLCPLIVMPVLSAVFPCERAFSLQWYLYFGITALIFLSPIAVVISAAGLFSRPPTAAWRGLMPGIIGSLFVPTFVFVLVNGTRRAFERQQTSVSRHCQSSE
jgi:hypothetical protein